MDKVCKLMGTVLSFLQRLAEMQVRRAHNASGLGWHLKVAKGGGINCKAVFVFFFFFGGGGLSQNQTLEKSKRRVWHIGRVEVYTAEC